MPLALNALESAHCIIIIIIVVVVVVVVIIIIITSIIVDGCMLFVSINAPQWWCAWPGWNKSSSSPCPCHRQSLFPSWFDSIAQSVRTRRALHDQFGLTRIIFLILFLAALEVDPSNSLCFYFKCCYFFTWQWMRLPWRALNKFNLRDRLVNRVLIYC